jgi:hypothetical protein
MSPWYRLVLGALATWRLTHLLNAEDGPWEIFVKLRRAVGDGFFGQLLDCFYCLSVWVAAPLAILLGETWTERLLLLLAFSALAIALERLTAEREPAPEPEPMMPHFVEDPEEPHGVLRKEADGDANGEPPSAGGPQGDP